MSQQVLLIPFFVAAVWLFCVLLAIVVSRLWFLCVVLVELVGRGTGCHVGNPTESCFLFSYRILMYSCTSLCMLFMPFGERGLNFSCKLYYGTREVRTA